jgi:sugar O-acyltransferase (sialic acid O-acetyltransferase NeuD family)
MRDGPRVDDGVMRRRDRPGRGVSRDPLAIVGAGGHAKVVIDLVERAGRHRILAVFDDDTSTWGLTLAGYPVVGGIGELLADWRQRCVAVVAIGDNAARHTISLRLTEQGVRLATVVHPAAVVARDVTLGAGTVVVALGVIEPGSVVGPGAIVNTSASVGHDCVLGDCAFIGPGARLTGNIRVGDLSFVGAGASVVPGRTIGRNVRVGAGAVVVDDVPDDVTVVGVPARVVRPRRPGGSDCPSEDPGGK